MLYVDTGCLLKLYYPEWNSAAVAVAVAGEEVCLTALHELEMATALELKVFRSEATPEQAAAARAAVEEDVRAGKLVRVPCDWAGALRKARELATRHSAVTGCRALDALHCAAVMLLGPLEFLSTDARQLALATAAGLILRPLNP